MLLFAGQDDFRLVSEEWAVPFLQNFKKSNLPKDAQNVWFDWDVVLYSVVLDGKKIWYVRSLKLDENPVDVIVFSQNMNGAENLDSKTVVCGQCIFLLCKSKKDSKLFKIQISDHLENDLIAAKESEGSCNFCFTDDDIVNVPTNMEGSYIVDISSNGKELFAIDSCGGVYNVYNVPKLLVRMESQNFVGIWSGHNFNVILTDTGAVYSWGHGNHGELGHRVSRIEETEPRRIDFFDDLPSVVTRIACGGWHSLALTSDGDIYSWGWNESGQLGHGTEKLAAITSDPYPVDIGSADNPIIDIACGSRHSAALTRKGELFCWGSNKFGQLGLSCSQYPSTSTPELVLSNYEKISKIRNLFCGRWATIIETD